MRGRLRPFWTGFKLHSFRTCFETYLHALVIQALLPDQADDLADEVALIDFAVSF